MKNNKTTTTTISTLLIIAIASMYMYSLAGSINQGLYTLSNSISELARTTGNNPEDLNAKNIGEAAVYLNIPKDTMLNIVEDEDSKIPHIKIGDTIIFYKQALDEWAKTARINIE